MAMRAVATTPFLRKFYMGLGILALSLGLLATFAGFGYLGRGMVRSIILPASTSLVHKHEVEAVYHNQMTEVKKALVPLGLQLGSTNSAVCDLDIAVRWHTAIDCRQESALDKPKVLNPPPPAGDPAVHQLVTSLQNAGWHGEADFSSYPFISFDKMVKDFHCNFQVVPTTNPHEFTANLFCSRDYYYFGNPYGHV